MTEEESRRLEFERIESRYPPKIPIGGPASSTDLKGFVTKNWRWLAVVALVCLGWKIDNWKHQVDLDHFFLKEITIVPVDADTRQPLEHIETSHSGNHYPSPFPQISCSYRKPSEAEFTIAAIEPLKIGVGAKGYLKSDVEISKDSDRTITVPLKKISATD